MEIYTQYIRQYTLKKNNLFKKPGFFFGTIFFFFIIFNINTVKQLILKWYESGTYSHGFLILPLVGYLIYREKDLIKNVPVESNYIGLILSAIVLFINYCGIITDTNIIKQFSLILMTHTLVIMVYGAKFYKKIAFPLFYLFFCIPFGDFLIPTLRDITANFVNIFFSLVNIPVYQEKWHITTAKGDFIVAEACSGLRYIIASVATCTLYSHLFFQKTYKKVVLISLSFILPVIANMIRAVIIISIAIFSDMKYAVGIDHLIYGWIFFLFIMIGMLFVSNKYCDEVNISHEKISRYKNNALNVKMCLSFLVLLLITIYYTQNNMATIKSAKNNSYHLETSFLKLSKLSEEIPYYYKPNQVIRGIYEVDKSPVNLDIAFYLPGNKEGKVISFMNKLYDKDIWHLLSHEVRKVGKLKINEYIISNNNKKYIIWHWYKIADKYTHSDYASKIFLLSNRIKGMAEEDMIFQISCEYDGDLGKATKVLSKFINDYKLMKS